MSVATHTPTKLDFKEIAILLNAGIPVPTEIDLTRADANRLMKAAADTLFNKLDKLTGGHNEFIVDEINSAPQAVIVWHGNGSELGAYLIKGDRFDPKLKTFVFGADNYVVAAAKAGFFKRRIKW